MNMKTIEDEEFKWMESTMENERRSADEMDKPFKWLVDARRQLDCSQIGAIDQEKTNFESNR